MSNNINLIRDIWNVLRTNIEDGDDVATAAETLVSYLIDETYSPKELAQAFVRDREMSKALKYYVETPEDSLLDEADADFDDNDLDTDDYYDDWE